MTSDLTTALSAEISMPPQLCFPNRSSFSPHRKEKAPKAPANYPQHIYIFSFTRHYFLFHHKRTDLCFLSHQKCIRCVTGGLLLLKLQYNEEQLFPPCHTTSAHTHTHTYTQCPRPVAHSGTDESNCEKQGFGHICVRDMETNVLLLSTLPFNSNRQLLTCW